MDIASLSLFLDILILFGLITTIYFALKLSNSLNNFKKQRKDFENTMRALGENIDHAYQSLSQMKDFAGSYDQDVQDALGEARILLDELKMMNKSGNSLADRLEHLASESRYAAQAQVAGDMDHIAQSLNEMEDESLDYDAQLYGNIAALEVASDQDDDDIGGFSIQDREFDAPHLSSAPSQAEQELLYALGRSRKRNG